jgi:hypothetical protein
MNRRGFLGFMGAAIAGATLDPERLLWRPNTKLISIPRPALCSMLIKQRIAKEELSDEHIAALVEKIIRHSIKAYDLQGTPAGRAMGHMISRCGSGVNA